MAILSAMETVNPKVPSTVEAGALCKMADRGQITGAILDGPLALDNAISLESVKIKQIDSPVAGRANVLVVPDLEAGNMLAKSLSFLAGADAAGIVLGARVPIILTSRADSVMTRLASCGIAALVAHARREAPVKVGGLDAPSDTLTTIAIRVVTDVADAIAVLNAGSSSFKFSLFVESAQGIALAARGQAEGLYTSPRFSAKDGAGAVIEEKSWGEGVSLGHEGALDHLVAFLRERLTEHATSWRGPPRRARRPGVRGTRARRCGGDQGARKIHPACAAPPASQSGAYAGAARQVCRSFRRLPASTRLSTGASRRSHRRSHSRSRFRIAASSVMAFMASRMNMSPA